MEQTKVEQIQDKICDYMLGVDLSKLPMNDLITYSHAYKEMKNNFSFPEFFSGGMCNSSISAPVPVQQEHAPEGE